MDTSVNQSILVIASQHNLHVQIRQLAKVLIFGPVETCPQRCNEIAEVILDATRSRSHVSGAN